MQDKQSLADNLYGACLSLKSVLGGVSQLLCSPMPSIQHDTAPKTLCSSGTTWAKDITLAHLVLLKTSWYFWTHHNIPFVLTHFQIGLLNYNLKHQLDDIFIPSFPQQSGMACDYTLLNSCWLSGKAGHRSAMGKIITYSTSLCLAILRQLLSSKETDFREFAPSPIFEVLHDQNPPAQKAV